MRNKRSLGAIGERIAARELEKMGYHIMERNFHAGAGEIDLIAQKEGMIVFVEVKLRTSLGQGLPSEAVTVQKQKHLVEAAKTYIWKKELTDFDFRFDVAEVLILEKQIMFRYLENAFWVQEDTI